MKLVYFLLLCMLLLAIYVKADIGYGYVRINISNQPPRVENISLTPETAFPDSTIECSAVIVDEDVKRVRVYFEWYKNDDLLDEKSSQLTDFESGDKITCKITPNDWAQNGTPAIISTTIQEPRPSAVVLRNTLNLLGSNTNLEQVSSYQEKGLTSITGFVVSSAGQSKGTVSLIGILMILVIVNINMIIRRVSKKSKEI